MIFNIIRYGTFTADDFINVHGSNDFSKFTSLPIDLRKKFISDVVDLYPNKESNKFKQAAFDFLDGKIAEDQFRKAYWKYWMAGGDGGGGGGGGVAAVVAVVGAHEYYRPHLKKHASHLNKLIQEYQS